MSDNLMITAYTSIPDSSTLMSTGYFAGTGANGVAYRFGYNNSIGVPTYIGAVYDSSISSYSVAFIAFTTSNLVLYYNQAWTGANTVSTFTANTSWTISGNAYKFAVIMSVPSDFPSFIPRFQTRQEMAQYFLDYTPEILYPITYHYENSVVSGPSEAAVGDTVTVSAVPNNNYGITDAASQILVTNNDVAVPYQWNPSTNTITFTMPDPT